MRDNLMGSRHYSGESGQPGKDAIRLNMAGAGVRRKRVKYAKYLTRNLLPVILKQDSVS